MDPERWRRVNEIFAAALDHVGDDLDALLESSCGDDVELRREVESLLEAHAEGNDLLESTAFEAGAELLHGRPGGPGSARDSLTGTRLGPYDVKSSLGYGGMGVVYLAEDTRLDRPVAIKALADHLGRDERSRERLRREAKAAAALSHHGIATVFALEEFDGRLYVVYEYVDGPTLREELEGGPLDESRLVGTALAMAQAMEAAHQRGIVHRDLKPENVIRTADDGVKILDFGLASFADTPLGPSKRGDEAAKLTLPGMVLGTPSYMAPEQLKGRATDFRADLFSFGVMLQEMATGIHPFEGDDPASTIARILELEPRSFEAAEHGRAGIAGIVERLLSKDPDDRYSATSDLVADLERVADLAPVAAPAPRPGPDSETRALRNEAFWWWRFHQFAIAVVYAVAVLGLWWIKEGRVGTTTETAAAGLFYLGIALIIVAGSLRIHLAFAARYYPRELPRQLHRSRRWIRPADLVYAVALVGGALLVGRDNTVLAALMIAAASGVVVFGLKIEPATTRAAFPPDVPLPGGDAMPR